MPVSGRTQFTKRDFARIPESEWSKSDAELAEQVGAAVAEVTEARNRLMADKSQGVVRRRLVADIDEVFADTLPLIERGNRSAVADLLEAAATRIRNG